MPRHVRIFADRARPARISPSAIAASVAAIAVTSILLASPARAATDPGSTPDGCSYGSGGPLASSLCWIDMSTFGSLTGSEIRGNSITKPMSLTIGGYKASFNITVSAGPTGSVGLTSAAFGSEIWQRAILGNTIAGNPYYTGTAGQPALYELADAFSPFAVSGPRETVKLDRLTVTDPKGKPVTNYSLVMTDAESTNGGEGFIWTSDAPLNNLQEVIPAAGNTTTSGANAPYGRPCNSVLSGFGTTRVTCQSTLIPGETSSSARGVVMVQSPGATSITSEITGRGGSGRQGIAFAIALPPIANDMHATIKPNQTATLNPSVRTGTKPVTAVAFDNGQTVKTVPGEGKWSIALANGQPVATFTPEKDYHGPVTPQPYTITDESKNTATAMLSVDINVPPTTTDAHQTIKPNQIATLKPTTIPGTGAVTGVAFDNGQTVKTVPGEGKWSIALANGQPVATFTPEKDYHGPVTPQPYTITDESKNTATAMLSVDINVPPTTTDAHQTIKPNQIATLKPTTIPGTGAVTGVAFDNGQTVKTVPGEGKWSIALANGQPVASFTPEKDYHGPVTPQPYTITDSNGMSARGKFSVIIGSAPLVPRQGSTHMPGVLMSKVKGSIVDTGGSIVTMEPPVGWAFGFAGSAVLLGIGSVALWRREARVR